MDKIKTRPTKTYYRIPILLIILLTSCYYKSRPIEQENSLKFGNEVLINEHIAELKNKSIALVINQTSVVNNTLLVDTLLALGIKIKNIFTPEHGFKGKYDAGKLITYNDDYKGIPITSLYGKNKKPTAEMLKNIDLIIFDIQDVGARFYTYTSTLAYVMEAAGENNIEVWVADRPNPNAFYVGGPVLEEKYKSFVGLFPVPVVYGLTIGEFAKMINEQKWIKTSCKLKIIPVKNYNRQPFISKKWIPPSPNLKSDTAALLYPALCFFEGTTVSVGRGTDNPFEIVGSPYHIQFKKYYENKVSMTKYGFLLEPIMFSPEAKPGASKPKYQNDTCYGVKITPTKEALKNPENFFLLSFGLLNSFYNEWLEYQKISGEKLPPFFNNYFEKLTGTDSVRKWIIQKTNEKTILNKIKNAPKFKNYLSLRQKYLIYR